MTVVACMKIILMLLEMSSRLTIQIIQSEICTDIMLNKHGLRL